MKTRIKNLYTSIKVKINYWMDRVIDQCDNILMNSSKLPLNPNFRIIENCTKAIGYTCLHIKSFPRVSVFELNFQSWKILFIGNPQKLGTILYTFFKNKEVNTREIARIAVWESKNLREKYFSQGVDLIIQHYAFPRQPDLKNFLFQTPEWIAQILPLSYPPEINLAGKDRYEKRKHIKKAEKFDLDWEYSHSVENFRYFHNNLYLPFVNSRHSKNALVNSQKKQYEHCFKLGGLILVKRDGKPIAGCLCYSAHSSFYAIELGIELDKNNYMNSGIKTYLDWCIIQQACQIGAETIELGGSLPLITNGVFKNKKRWGAKVVQRRRIDSHFNVFGNAIPDDLQNYINQSGFISEYKGKFYRTLLQLNHVSEENEFIPLINYAQESGLEGIHLINNEGSDFKT